MTNKPQEPQVNTGAGVLLILLVLGGVIWWAFTGGQLPAVPGVMNAQITYQVTASCPFDVTYSVDNASQQQETGMQSPWSKSVSTSIPVLLAQVKCEGGTVTTQILDSKGNVIKQASSSGDYVIATVTQ